MATTDTETEEQLKSLDPFKDFVQSSFKDGAEVATSTPKKTDAEAPVIGDDDLVDEDFEGTPPKTAKEPEKEEEKKPNKVPAKERYTQLEAKIAALGATDAAAIEAAKALDPATRIHALTGILRERERKIAAAKSPPPPPPVTKIEPKTATDDEKAKDPNRPKLPSPEDDKYEFGAVDEKYLKDYVSGLLAQNDYDSRKAASDAEGATAKEAAAREEQEFRGKLNSELERGKTLYDDFDEVVIKGAEQGKYPLSQTFGRLLAESEVGAEMAYDLAKDLDLAKEIAGLSDARQAVRFGKMEDAKIAAVKAAKAAPTKNTPAAPEPLQAKNRGAGGSFVAPADSEDFAAFERMAQPPTRK